jgi:hypothetical protein
MVCSAQGFTSLVVGTKKKPLLDLSVHLRGGSVRVVCIIMPPGASGHSWAGAAHLLSQTTLRLPGLDDLGSSNLFFILLFVLCFLYKKLPT